MRPETYWTIYSLLNTIATKLKGSWNKENHARKCNGNNLNTDLRNPKNQPWKTRSHQRTKRMRLAKERNNTNMYNLRLKLVQKCGDNRGLSQWERMLCDLKVTEQRTSMGVARSEICRSNSELKCEGSKLDFSAVLQISLVFSKHKLWFLEYLPLDLLWMKRLLSVWSGLCIKKNTKTGQREECLQLSVALCQVQGLAREGEWKGLLIGWFCKQSFPDFGFKVTS